MVVEPDDAGDGVVAGLAAGLLASVLLLFESDELVESDPLDESDVVLAVLDESVDPGGTDADFLPDRLSVL